MWLVEWWSEISCQSWHRDKVPRWVCRLSVHWKPSFKKKQSNSIRPETRIFRINKFYRFFLSDSLLSDCDISRLLWGLILGFYQLQAQRWNAGILKEMINHSIQTKPVSPAHQRLDEPVLWHVKKLIKTGEPGLKTQQFLSPFCLCLCIDKQFLFNLPWPRYCYLRIFTCVYLSIYITNISLPLFSIWLCLLFHDYRLLPSRFNI